MKKVDSFMTSDGKLFLDEGEAQEHQDALDLAEKLRRFFNHKDCQFDFDSKYDTQDILNGIVEQSSLFLKIMKE